MRPKVACSRHLSTASEYYFQQTLLTTASVWLCCIYQRPLLNNSSGSIQKPRRNSQSTAVPTGITRVKNSPGVGMGWGFFRFKFKYYVGARQLSRCPPRIGCARLILSPEIEFEQMSFITKNPKWFLIFPSGKTLLTLLIGPRVPREKSFTNDGKKKKKTARVTC